MLGKSNSDLYLPHINQPGGVLTSLEKNLSDRGFLDLVSIIKGDFLCHNFEGERFELIFSDAMHGVKEIQRNIGTTLGLLKPGGFLLCDDISSEAEVEAIVSAAEFDWFYVDSLLFYGKLKAI